MDFRIVDRICDIYIGELTQYAISMRRFQIRLTLFTVNEGSINV